MSITYARYEQYWASELSVITGNRGNINHIYINACGVYTHRQNYNLWGGKQFGGSVTISRKEKPAACIFRIGTWVSMQSRLLAH